MNINGNPNSDFDDFEEPVKSANSRKSMAPLFVYQILTERTNKYRHYRYQDIIRNLDAYPYAISLERKSVGRIVKSLLSEDQLNLREDATGVWYEAGCNFPKAS